MSGIGKRWLTALLIAAVVATGTVGALIGAPEGASAAPAGTGSVRSDFNDDGYADLAIGAPSDVVGGVKAGAVNVIYGSSQGLSATTIPDQRWTEDSAGIADGAEEGDLFGWSVATDDFNGDGYADLAVGSWGEDLGSVANAGVVHVVYGSRDGLSTTAHAAQLWSQDSTAVEEVAEANDQFGWRVGAGDFNGDGFGDLAVGVISEDVAGASSAGIVQVIYGSSGGLSATTVRTDQVWSQATPSVEGVAEAGDLFGSVLTTANFNGDGYDDLVIGSPREDVGTVTDAGAINVIHGSLLGLSATIVPDQFWDLESPSIDGSAGALDLYGTALAGGDFNGDGDDDLAIGVPLKDLVFGSVTADAGMVSVIYGSPSGLSATAVRLDQLLIQGIAGIDDIFEESDFFGATLAAGRFDPDGYDDLAVGAPSEAVGSADVAGTVDVVFGSPNGLSAITTPDQFWTQDSPKVEDAAETNDTFGSALAGLDVNGDGKDDLAIAAEFEGLDAGPALAGQVEVLHGTNSGLSAKDPIPDQIWNQDTTKVEGTAATGDRFGRDLA